MDEQVYLPVLKFSTRPPGIANVLVSLWTWWLHLIANTQEIAVVSEYSPFLNIAHAFLCKLLHSRLQGSMSTGRTRPLSLIKFVRDCDLVYVTSGIIPRSKDTNDPLCCLRSVVGDSTLDYLINLFSRHRWPKPLTVVSLGTSNV